MTTIPDVPRNPNWPVLKRYRGESLRRLAMPLGGIGTGTVSLGGRGDLRDWEIVNRPAKGFTPGRTFFALYARADGQAPVTRVLEGLLGSESFEGSGGATAANHGLPRCRRSEFLAAYPLGQVLLSDPALPVAVRLEAFNPLVPVDADASGIPAAVLRFVLLNPNSRAVEAAICGNLENFVGTDGSAGRPCRNVNEFRRGGGVQGLFMRSDGVDPGAEQWGTLALAALTEADVSVRTHWWSLSWNRDILDVWEDFAADGRLDDRPVPSTNPAELVRRDEVAPRGSLAVRVTVPAQGQAAVTFLLTWHFPNRRTWTPLPKDQTPGACSGPACDPDRIGNYYATQYRDAWDVATRTAARLARLEQETVAFVSALCDSDLPAAVKEAALFNLTGLRSQTAFRTSDGRLYGWEGCHDRAGCCHGSCTHVWNYEQATAFLFGELALTMREVEFLHATGDDGHMNFRVSLPLERARQRGLAAADGQMGCLLKLYRDWQLSGDDARLRALWPKARLALEFCWIKGGWDGDRDGVMEGCQHNTMDVEYYGPNPQMQFWYLGALRAAEEMARHLGETAFAQDCRRRFEQGRRWTDANLFNGEYYEHQIRPVTNPITDIAPGLKSSMGADDPTRPIYQLGTGCLVDQLVGQLFAHVCDLGYLAEPRHIRQTLRSILKHNFRPTLWDHVNNMRSFALNHESALLMASYPRGGRPAFPFPYFTEVMTGFEYTAAVGMLYEAQAAAGLRCIRAVRARYDGKRRSPFDEAECGHHYARAMVSWAAVLALTGFHYSAVTGTMRFAAISGQHFWSNGWAWGTCRIRREPGGQHEVELRVLGGALSLRRFELRGVGGTDLAPAPAFGAGAELRVEVNPAPAQPV